MSVSLLAVIVFLSVIVTDISVCLSISLFVHLPVIVVDSVSLWTVIVLLPVMIAHLSTE